MPGPPPKPSIGDVRVKIHEKFHVRPCLWQIQTIQAILERQKDVILIAGTGMGKTLAFFGPLCFLPERSGYLLVLVSPLNLLGEQHVRSLADAGMKGIFIGGKTATSANFEAIQNGKYDVVIISPEQFAKVDGGFRRLCESPAFVKRIVGVVFDEAHCVSTWNGFRPEYQESGWLRERVPDVPIVAASATMPSNVQEEVMKILEMRRENALTIRRSSDRPNIKIYVRPIRNTLTGFSDLDFVLNGWRSGAPDPPKFVVFFDNINESIKACQHIRSLLPVEQRRKVTWFNSDMTDVHKAEYVAALQKGDIWGLFTTESFGMGIDISNIVLAVQWRLTRSLCALWQRFGRAVRDKGLSGTAVYLVEPEYFDEERRKKEMRKEARENKKRKKDEDVRDDEGTQPEPKRVRLSREDVEPHSLPSGSQMTVVVEQVPGPPRRRISDQELVGRYQGAVIKTDDRQKKGEIELVMDDFVNAGERDIGCRRRVLDAFFGNHLAGTRDYIQCNPDDSQGCRRCVVVRDKDKVLEQSGVSDSLIPACVNSNCCDLDPILDFTPFTVPSIKGHHRPPRTSLNDENPMSEEAIEQLLGELEDWAERTTIKDDGLAVLRLLGTVMPDAVMKRIVECTRHHVYIHSVEQLARETRWDDAEKYGKEVIEIINRHFPPPVALTTAPSTQPSDLTSSSHPPPFQPVPNSVDQTFRAQKTRGPGRCSICRQPGHNMRRCTRKPSTASSFKENTPPSLL